MYLIPPDFYWITISKHPNRFFCLFADFRS